MGSIASRFQNFQLAPQCPLMQDEIADTDSYGDDDDTNDSTESTLESNFGIPENVANIANGDNYQAHNTSVVPSSNCPEVLDEIGAVSEQCSNGSTVSMIENIFGVPEHNITNSENFLVPNTFNLDDIETASMSELNVRHVDDLESNIDSFVDSSSVIEAASNMSESNFVTIENTPRIAEDSRFVETGRTPKKTSLSRTGVAPLPQNRCTGSCSSQLFLKNATNKLSTRRQPQKSRIMRASKSATKKDSGICRFCKLKMRQTKRNTTTRKHKAMKRKAKPFKIPKTVQTILKYTSEAAASPKTNAYHNFLLYYNIRCNDASVSGRQRRTCGKARHVWKTMNAEEKLPFSLLAQKERRKILRRTQGCSQK